MLGTGRYAVAVGVKLLGDKGKLGEIRPSSGGRERRGQ